MNLEACMKDFRKIPDIPHVSIDTRFVGGKDQLRCFPGHYVSVRDENATYHVSHPGFNCLPNALVVARTSIYRDNYDPETMARFRNNFVFDFLNNKAFVFDNNADYRVWDLQEVTP